VKVTTDLRKGCTESHTGTSASAPLAAGICALVLQVKYVWMTSLSRFTVLVIVEFTVNNSCCLVHSDCTLCNV